MKHSVYSNRNLVSSGLLFKGLKIKISRTICRNWMPHLTRDKIIVKNSVVSEVRYMYRNANHILCSPIHDCF